MSGDRQFAASPQKLKQLRRKGVIPISSDFRGAVGLAAGALFLAADPARFVRETADLMERHIAAAPKVVDIWFDLPAVDRPAIVMRTLAGVGWEVIRCSLPLLLLITAVVTVTGWIQTGGLVAPERLNPKFERLNPFSGFKRLFFDRRSWIEQGRASLKLVLLSAALWLMLGPSMRALSGLDVLEWNTLDRWFLGAFRRILLGGAGVFLVLGVVDVLVQRFLFLTEQKMTREELKREIREVEGNPWVRSVRRTLARDMLTADIKSAVPRCDLITNNPTHVSVGIRFSRIDRNVAWVMIKGTDGRAEAIRREASAVGVSMVENVPLARALLRVPERDRVPRELFRALRETLVWIKSTEARRAAQRRSPFVDKTDDADADPGNHRG